MPDPTHDAMNDHPDQHDAADVSLLSLASQIDDGQSIDWDTAEGRARDEKERGVLAELRLLATLTRVCRDPDEGAPENLEATEPLPPVSPAPEAFRWGPLAVVEPVGRGGFAQVYRARDQLNRDVALKLFPIARKRAPALAKRVLREGSLLARIHHRNVVVVHGVARHKDHIGLWMEFIDGRTMENELKTRGSLSAEEATLIGVDLCRALAAVHNAGLLHRDVKAQNVMREEGGRTVLMDFGAGSEELIDPFGRVDVAGTPLYLAPELFYGQKASRAADIYSLGVLLFRMVTGKYPVDGANRTELALAHREGRRLRLRDLRPDLPVTFVQAVEGATAANPKERYQTAASFESALAGLPVTERAPSWRQWLTRAALASAAAVLVALPAWLVIRDRSDTAAPAPLTAVDPASQPAPGGIAGTYNVDARFYRREGGRPEAPLVPGQRIAPGEAIALRFEASAPVFLYVVNIDDSSEILLFSPGKDGKPLAPSRAHWLPGPSEGENNSWLISSAGGREQFVLLASPERVPEFEELVKDLPTPVPGSLAQAARVPESLSMKLRGVGGLVTTAPGRTDGRVLRWFEEFDELRGGRETAKGTWTKRVAFEKPSR
jgi:tRNA A-37 threonylcarbamoyl transferase component Bud32